MTNRLPHVVICLCGRGHPPDADMDCKRRTIPDIDDCQ
jgi:hypothetical protein